MQRRETHQAVLVGARRQLAQRRSGGRAAHRAERVGRGGPHVGIGVAQPLDEPRAGALVPDPRQRIHHELAHVPVAVALRRDQAGHHARAAAHQRLDGRVAAARVLAIAQRRDQRLRRVGRVGAAHQALDRRLAHAPARIAQPVHQELDRLVQRSAAGALHREPAQLGVLARRGRRRCSRGRAHRASEIIACPSRAPPAAAPRPGSPASPRTRASTRCAKWPRPSAISDSKLSITFPARIAAFELLLVVEDDVRHDDARQALRAGDLRGERGIRGRSGRSRGGRRLARRLARRAARARRRASASAAARRRQAAAAPGARARRSAATLRWAGRGSAASRAGSRAAGGARVGVGAVDLAGRAPVAVAMVDAPTSTTWIWRRLWLRFISSQIWKPNILGRPASSITARGSDR